MKNSFSLKIIESKVELDESRTYHNWYKLLLVNDYLNNE